MKLNALQTDILRAISHRPRQSRDWTHGTRAISPHNVELYFDAMAHAGLIEEPEREGGAYTITAEGLAYLEQLPTAAPPVQFGNYSMPPGSLVLPAWPHAAERGERNKLIRSRGV